MYLFVYGSLKRGFSNHHFLNGQTFLGDAVTLPTARVYNCGGFPGAVADSSPGSYPVSGELWEVDQAALRRIDWLEETESGIYTREEWRVHTAGQVHVAEIYLYRRSLDGLEETGPVWPLHRDVLPPTPIEMATGLDQE